MFVTILMEDKGVRESALRKVVWIHSSNLGGGGLKVEEKYLFSI